MSAVHQHLRLLVHPDPPCPSRRSARSHPIAARPRPYLGTYRVSSRRRYCMYSESGADNDGSHNLHVIIPKPTDQYGAASGCSRQLFDGGGQVRTSGQPPSGIGRNVSSAGTVAITLEVSYGPDSPMA